MLYTDCLLDRTKESNGLESLTKLKNSIEVYQHATSLTKVEQLLSGQDNR